MTEIVANKASILKLVNILIIFIKQKQAKIKKIENTLKNCCKDNNSSWINKYSIQIYGLIAI